jgi:RHS repeat-associated protein
MAGSATPGTARTLDATGNASRWSLRLAAAPPVVSRENRLVEAYTGDLEDPANGDKKVKFVYDYMGRRVQKAVYTYSDSWPENPGEVQRFVYDGWNPVLVLNGNNEITRRYTWGLDLSGSIQGAGGIGGLLACEEPQAEGDPKRYWFFYDANGNVVQVLDATDTENITIAATYEYDPYGNMIAINDVDQSGYAYTNPFRFSTKWYDSETGQYYFGRRYYDPRTGRWTSEDPIREAGGLNTYQAMRNDPLNRTDLWGLLPAPWTVLQCRQYWNVYTNFWLNTKDAWIQYNDWADADKAAQKALVKKYLSGQISQQDFEKQFAVLTERLHYNGLQAYSLSTGVYNLFNLTLLTRWMSQEGCKCNRLRELSYHHSETHEIKEVVDLLYKIPEGPEVSYWAIWVIHNVLTTHDPDKGIFAIERNNATADILRDIHLCPCEFAADARAFLDNRWPANIRPCDLYQQTPMVETFSWFYPPVKRLK